MTTPRKHMKLGAFFHPTGNHLAAWLYSESQIDAGVNFNHYVELAQIAERGKFDLMFLADASATRDGRLNALSRWPQYMAYFEPLTLLSGIAALTKHIGLVATSTTSYNEPYHIARRYASLDHISGGRAGWNVVTSSNVTESYNFGREKHYEPNERYERATEFVEVVKGLWDSWEDDAFVRDRATATYFIPEKLHYLRHKGTHFSVRGPLNVARPPQGYPVFAQAGASEAGIELAAKIAEIVFTPALSLESAQAFYQNVKSRMAKYGRSPDHLKLMPGLNVIVGRTQQEAEEKHQLLQSLIHPDVGKELLSAELAGFDLTPFPVDGPLPYDLIATETRGSMSSLKGMVEMAKRDNLTIRQLYMRYAGARGQRTLKGTPEFIADDMEHWFKSFGVDGFLIQPAYLPGGLKDFVDLVIPELQRRGVFRKEYEGRTLRENLGLPRPISRYAAAQTSEASSLES
jgi:N-acetyl-S-(2-succino)cysteine monooxygenase